MYTRASSNALRASLCAVASADSKSFGPATSRIPLPPPPAAALSMIGYPMERAYSLALASPPSGMGSFNPGTTGTPASMTLRRARVFSPISSIASGGGPMNRIPALAQARAKAAFSERKPYPGWTASARVALQAAITLSMTR